MIWIVYIKLVFKHTGSVSNIRLTYFLELRPWGLAKKYKKTKKNPCFYGHLASEVIAYMIYVKRIRIFKRIEDFKVYVHVQYSHAVVIKKYNFANIFIGFLTYVFT